MFFCQDDQVLKLYARDREGPTYYAGVPNHHLLSLNKQLQFYKKIRLRHQNLVHADINHAFTYDLPLNKAVPRRINESVINDRVFNLVSCRYDLLIFGEWKSNIEKIIEKSQF